jgi:hypothetical protein
MLEAPALSVLFLLLAVVGLLDQGVAVSLANGVSQAVLLGLPHRAPTGGLAASAAPRTVDGLLGPACSFHARWTLTA